MKRWQKLTAILAVVGTVAGLGGAARAEEEEEFRVQYKVGDGLRIGNGANMLHISGRVQARFTYDGLEGSPDKDTWAIQRGKFKIDGHTLNKKLKFEFQLNTATRSAAKTIDVCVDAGCTTTQKVVQGESTSGLPVLEDAYADWVPYDYFGIRLGQFKVPYLRQRLVSSGKQQFVDRSLSTQFFDLAYDLGIAFHGNLWQDGLNYDVFFMNGDGANTINKNQSMMVGARLEYPILGTYERSESDINNSQEASLGVGLSAFYNELGNTIQGGSIAAGTKTANGTVDIGYKYKGFSFEGAGIITRALEIARLTNIGLMAQAGYFLIPKKLEVAVKESALLLSNAAPNQYESSVGLNYFIVGHGIKIQTDYAMLMNVRGINLNDHRFRTQLQFIF